MINTGLIRDGQIADTIALTHMAHRHVVPDYDTEFDFVHTERSILLHIQKCQADRKTHYGRVYVSQGHIQAYLAGSITSEFYNQNTRAKLLFWYSEAHMSGIKLLRDFEKWAADQKTQYIDIGFSNPNVIHTTPDSWLESHGYELITKEFRRPTEWVE